MSRENVELLRAALDAYNRHDLDAYLALMHADVEARPRMADVEGTVYEGHADLGDRTLAALRNHGRGAAGGTPVEQESWLVSEWRDGKVVCWAAYESEAEAVEAAT